MPKLEILMSVMHQTDMHLAERCNADTDILIINQCNKDDYSEEIYNGHKIRMISTTERGLSKSRNKALKNACGDICVLCDDDVIYNTGYKEEILKAFSERKDADIIAFNVEHKNARHKRKMNKSFKKAPKFHTYCSVSLVFKHKNILKEEVLFNELFGAGSGVITSGEEAVWQNDALKKGLKIYEHPFCIATVDQANSTWFKGYTEQYFYNMGAYVATVMPSLKHIFKFYYIYRINAMTDLTVKEQLHWLNAGIKGIKDGKSYDEYRGIS